MHTRHFRFLLISDFHAGEHEHPSWTAASEAFLEDLSRLHERLHQIDAVIFAGDATQSGKPEEFITFNKLVVTLLQHFKQLGSEPAFFAVPGNHDLKRPAKPTAADHILAKWSEHPEIHHEFWTNEGNEYRARIEKAFANYASWSNDAIRAARPGILPGDALTTLSVNGLSIGLAGLNTAFLQHQAGDYHGKLLCDSRQLSTGCSNSIPAWTANHDFNILVSHHPPHWLSNDGQRNLAEFAPPQKFILHCYGHEHEPASAIESRF